MLKKAIIERVCFGPNFTNYSRVEHAGEDCSKEASIYRSERALQFAWFFFDLLSIISNFIVF